MLDKYSIIVPTSKGGQCSWLTAGSQKAFASTVETAFFLTILLEKSGEKSPLGVMMSLGKVRLAVES